jgi:ankyrin repeat protein
VHAVYARNHARLPRTCFFFHFFLAVVMRRAVFRAYFPEYRDSLCLAAQRGDCDGMARALQVLPVPADADMCRVALRFATMNDHVEAVAWLLDRGVPVYYEHFVDTLSTAAVHGSLDVAKLLLDRQVASVDHSCVYRAIRACRADSVRFLLQAKADPDGWPAYYVHQAIYADADEVVQVLVDAKADPERGQSRPLTIAAKRGNHVVVRMLLQAKADPDTSERGIVCLDRVRHVDVARALLEFKADVRRADLREALHCPATLQLLLAAKADVHAHADDLFTWADYHRKLSSVQVLLDAGVRPSRHAVNCTLQRAAATHRDATKHVRTITTTAMRDACTQKMLDNALLEASKSCNVGAAVPLLEAGADPGFASHRAARLLHYACQIDCVDFASALLAAKAAPDVPRVMQTCRTFGSDDVLALLVATSHNIDPTGDARQVAPVHQDTMALEAGPVHQSTLAVEAGSAHQSALPLEVGPAHSQELAQEEAAPKRARTRKRMGR